MSMIPETLKDKIDRLITMAVQDHGIAITAINVDWIEYVTIQPDGLDRSIRTVVIEGRMV